MANKAKSSAIVAIATLSALSLEQVSEQYKKEYQLSANKIISRAKYIATMESKLPEGKSIRAYMKDTFGEIDANVYKPVKVFRELVALNSDGTAKESAGAGEILESHFDSILAPTIHIEASAILGFIEKKHEGNAEEIAAHRELLADILRKHTSDAETKKLLATLKGAVKPEAKKGEGEGEGEGDGAEGTDANKAAATAQVTPMMLLDMLTGPAGKDNWRGIMEHAKHHPTSAFEIAEKIQKLAQICHAANKAVMEFIPMAVEKAA